MSSFHDYSGNGNHGSPSGVRWEKKPSTHVRYVLASENRITVSNSPLLESMTEGTIIAYSDEFKQTTEAYDIITSKGLSSNHPLFSFSNDAVGQIYLTDSVNTRGAINPYAGKKSVAVSFRNEETPYSYTDGTNKVVFDGEIICDGTSSADLVIGNLEGYSFACSNPLKGVLYYAVQLTDDEIAQAHSWIMEQKSVSRAKKNFIYPSQLNKSPNILAAYEMNNIHGKVIDITGQGYEGTITKCSGGTIIGGISALRFNGSDSKVLVDKNVDLTSTDFSFEALVKTATVSTNMVIVSRRTTGTCYVYMRIDSSAGYLRAVFVGTGGSVSNVYGPSTSVANNKWHHVVLTADRDGNAILYLDSVPGTPVSIAAIGSLSSSDLEIGAREAIESFNGLISEVAVYNKCLSQAEVSVRYRKYASIPTFLDDLEDANESVTVEGGAVGNFLSNTCWRFGDTIGRYKVLRDETLGVGQKVIECTTAGLLYQENRQSYGTWSFDIYHVDSSNTQLLFIADTVGNKSASGQDGYYFDISTTEVVSVGESVAGTPTDKVTNASGVGVSTWTNFKITRSCMGVFTLYRNNVLLGSTFTDTTATNSTYFVLDFDAGDKISDLRLYSGVF